MDANLSKEDYERLYGKPENVVNYMDYTNGQEDNSSYIPILVPGMFQLLEELSDQETDEFLKTIDIEALVKQAEQSTGGLPPNHPVPNEPAVNHSGPNLVPAEKDLKRFSAPSMELDLKEVTNHSFSATTKRKALWAARIFDQWKCIWNYKLKVDKTLSYPEVHGTLVNMDLDVMCETLCMFVLEICKQSGEEYPRETL